MAYTRTVEILKGDNKKNRASRVVVKATYNITGSGILFHDVRDILGEAGVELDDYRFGHCWVKITPNMTYTDESCSVKHRAGVDDTNTYVNLVGVTSTSSTVRSYIPMTLSYVNDYSRRFGLEVNDAIVVYMQTSGTAPDYTLELYYVLWN